MFFSLIVLAGIVLGLFLIAIGAYLWLAVKKKVAGIILLAVGLIFTLSSVAFIALITIMTSSRG